MTDDLTPAAPAVERLTHYTRDEQTVILGDGTDPYGVKDTGLTWGPKDAHFGVSQDGRLVAHAGVVALPVSIGGTDTEVVGLGGVAVAPDHRGRGLARLVVAGALDHARTMGPRYGLLFCLPRLVPLYRRLGWSVVEGEVEVQQPEGPVVMPLRTMWTPLHDGAAWPEGALRLRSLPM
jgi:predicted N-acetyltransferase YhbS